MYVPTGTTGAGNEPVRGGWTIVGVMTTDWSTDSGDGAVDGVLSSFDES